MVVDKVFDIKEMLSVKRLVLVERPVPRLEKNGQCLGYRKRGLFADRKVYKFCRGSIKQIPWFVGFKRFSRRIEFGKCQRINLHKIVRMHVPLIGGPTMYSVDDLNLAADGRKLPFLSQIMDTLNS